MKFFFKMAVLFLLNTIFMACSFAANPTQESELDEDMAEMNELMGILEEETTIATKTKINSDFVPGMVTVLHGDDMQALGKLNVWEALSLVPGLKTLKTNTGVPLLIARGVPFPFNNGNIKIMLNSITMSSEISGINSSMLFLPIEQVERIEFIRGPSSSIYGSSAYLGLLNIITYKENKRLLLSSNESSLSNIGGQYYWNDEEKKLKVSANLMVKRDHDAVTILDTEATDKQTSFIFNVDYEKTSFTAHLFERKLDIDELRPTTLENDEKAASIEIKQKIQFSETVKSELKISHRDNEFEENKVYRGSLSRIQMDFNWDMLEYHQILLGLNFEHYDIDEATLCLKDNQLQPNLPGFRMGIPPPTTSTQNPLACPRPIKNDAVLTNESWNNVSFSIQDQYALSDNLSLIGGFGVSKDDNIKESNITPRLAFVWKMTDHHLLKAQYTKGFRTPTYFELYDLEGNKSDLESEQINSYEVGYIYKNNNLLSRVTLFYSKLDQLIVTEGHGYKNDAETKTKGIELEWEQKLNKYFKWSANLSYTDAKDGFGKDNKKTKANAGTSDWLGNLNLYLQPKDNMLMTLQYYYVGEQTTIGDNIDGYNNLDFTLSLFQLLHKKITFRAGVKNLLDDEILFFDTRPDATEAIEYPGRTWWAQISYDL
jgi:outer membrane receptor for ferrienterochelin and colicins